MTFEHFIGTAILTAVSIIGFFVKQLVTEHKNTRETLIQLATKHDGIERNVSTLMVDVSGMKDRLARIETTLGTKPVARKRVSG